jgi:hypothetical protein
MTLNPTSRAPLDRTIPRRKTAIANLLNPPPPPPAPPAEGAPDTGPPEGDIPEVNPLAGILSGPGNNGSKATPLLGESGTGATRYGIARQRGFGQGTGGHT